MFLQVIGIIIKWNTSSKFSQTISVNEVNFRKTIAYRDKKKIKNETIHKRNIPTQQSR